MVSTSAASSALCMFMSIPPMVGMWFPGRLPTCHPTCSRCCSILPISACASLPSPSILGALAEYSCDHQFRCGCRGRWRYLFEGDELFHTETDVVLRHSRKPDRRSGFSRQERLGIANSGAPQTISLTLTGEEDRGLREENELCWLGREGRQLRHSTPLRQSRENLDQAFLCRLLPTRIGEHLQSDG